MTDAYAELLARAEADPEVVGLILSGSKARGQDTEHSDHDVYVVVREYGGQWTDTTRTPGLDTAPVSLADLADVSDRWQRYAFRGAVVVLDRLDGQVAALVRAQATLSPDEARAMVREQLDGYINFVYRAAKNRRAGLEDLARLEEIEAAPWLLWTLFALYGRVRPYNKYLRWELDTFPLPAPWTADHLITSLSDRPSQLFPALEYVARLHGFGDVIDGWDDLALLPGRRELIAAADALTGRRITRVTYAGLGEQDSPLMGVELVLDDGLAYSLEWRSGQFGNFSLHLEAAPMRICDDYRVWAVQDEPRWAALRSGPVTASRLIWHPDLTDLGVRAPAALHLSFAAGEVWVVAAQQQGDGTWWLGADDVVVTFSRDDVVRMGVDPG
ncbi:hypothetical protein [Actinoplanes sp. NPDC051494]|uniref:hypothetical protein n=1 Tax=Actinoplanes sp. NPDC051494 TaxID=3363907 RepID=UPI0037A702C6